MDWILWLAASVLWGYLAGVLLSKAIEWVQFNTRPIRVPVVTGIVLGLERGLRWYIRAVQEIVSGMASGLEVLLCRRGRRA